MHSIFALKYVGLFITATLHFASLVSSDEWPWGPTAGISKEDFVQQLTGKLTVAELAQHLSLIKYTDFADPTTGEATSFATLAADRGIGEINFWTPKDSNEFNKLQALVINSSRVPVPLLQSGECLHSTFRQNSTVFPANIDLASTWNNDLVYQVARGISKETRAVGQHNCYAPVLDIVKDARWGRIGETFGEDKFLISSMGVSFVSGLQNDGNLSSTSAAIATIKHFLGHGASNGGRNVGPADIGKRELYGDYMLPFRSVIELADAKGVMVAYNTIDKAASAWNPELISALTSWGFSGRVVSDDHDISRSLTWHNAAIDAVDAVAKWLNTGGSVNYADWPNSQWTSLVEQAVAQGKVPLSVLQQRVMEVMEVKYDVGLFDNPFLPTNFSHDKFDTEEAQDLALSSAQQSIILLKNEGNILPLSQTPSKVALIGPFVELPTLGGYVKYGIHARTTTLRQGILNYTSPEMVETSWGASDWLDFRPQVIPYYLLSPPKQSPFAGQNATGLNSTKFFDSSPQDSGLLATYYSDQNFQKPAWQTIEGPLLEYNIYPPNAPDGSAVLPNTKFSVRWEGYLTAPSTVKGAIGSMLNNGYAAVYIDDVLVVNASRSVVSSYCDGPGNWWSHYRANSSRIPDGLVEFDFVKGRQYKLRIDFISTSTGVVAPAWNLVERPSSSDSGSVSSGVQHAVSAAQDADVVVLAVGSSPPSDQETCDASTLSLTPNQTALADAIFELGKPVVLITYGPRPKGLREYYRKAAAVLRSGYGGQAGGTALADIIVGTVNPSGRLPLTIPESAGTIPAFYNHEGGDYHYRYSDLPFEDLNGNTLPEGTYGAVSTYNPLFHFGFGLSYTNFTYGPLSVTSKSGTANGFQDSDVLTFSFAVSNVGDVMGRDVPQIYLLSRHASVAQPVLQLYGFDNLELSPGETRTSTIELDVDRYLSSFDVDYNWGIDGNNFTFAVMKNSGDVTTNNVTLVYQS